MKFCCGVTLYYPSQEEINNVLMYSKIFDHVYIFDNTDSHAYRKNRENFKNKKDITYISFGENKGLSVAYNSMCDLAIKNDFDYICLLDQDSSVHNEDFEKIKNKIYIDNKKNVAIYVPKIVYKHKEYKMKNDNNDCEIEWEISSGSFINLMVYMKTNKFDENYFIDRLDYDYCYQVRRLGYKIIRINDVELHQKLGEVCSGIFSNVSQHNTIRHYYIFRNRLYFNYKYYSRIKAGAISILQTIKHVGLIILFENNKLAKIREGYIGIKDFINKNLGKKGGY